MIAGTPPNAEPPTSEASRRSRIWRVARPILLLAVAFLAARIIIGIVGAIDWSAVWSALGLLTLPAVILLLLALACRQVFNAVPLTRFVPDLSLPRSVQNDVTAFLMGTIAPPPSDVVLRVSMFRSWGIDPVEGMAGVTLNMLVFYVIRFGAPALGLLVLMFEELDSGQVWLALGSALIAVAVLVAILSISRGDRLATLIGYTAGKVANRFRSDVEPRRWADAVVAFRARVGDRVTTGVGPSLLAMLAMVLSDAVILLISLRAVGIEAEDLPWQLVVGAFLLAYPLTLFPLAGLGVLDAVLVAAWTKGAGTEFEAQIVAALIIWRAVTLLVPIAMGAVALVAWRSRRSVSDES